MRLSRDDVFKKVSLATEEVEVPEWGGSLLVRGMTGKERDMFERGMTVAARLSGIGADDMEEMQADFGVTTGSSSSSASLRNSAKPSGNSSARSAAAN